MAAEAPRISVCIVCRNEADRLAPCLESVAWADEAIVMDLDSTDGSAALAESYGARVVRRAPQLRMYRKSAVRWPEIPNALPDVPEARRLRLPADDALVMIHDRSRTVPEILERSLRYAPLQAQSMIDRGQVFTARAMLTA